MTHALFQSFRIGVQQIQLALRSTMGAVLSLFAALWLELPYPIYAFLAAVIVTDLKPSVTQKLGLRRIGATVVGAFTGAVLSQMVPGGPWSVGLGVFVAMILAQLLNAGEGARVAGYISGIVLLDHTTAPWAYALNRFLETALGVLVAWAISHLPKLIDSERKADGQG